jgi:hypothetical protein
MELNDLDIWRTFLFKLKFRDVIIKFKVIV